MADPHLTARPSFRRSQHERWVGGVCGGLARTLGIDPLLVRLGFVVGATAGGFGVVAYVLLWALLPAGDAPADARLRRPDRGSLEVAAGIGCLALAVVLGLREIGWWFSDALVWPTALVAAGAALIWRQGQRVAQPSPAAATPATAAEQTRERVAVVSRTGMGVALVVLAAITFLQLTGALSAVRDVALVAFTVAAGLAVVFAPVATRLARSLSAERDARIRSQERAELSAHLHDSVLQTLALVQRRAEDPRAVAALARRQERELRGWLAGRTGTSVERLSAALEEVADEVEADHGVEVEVVVAGDASLDGHGRALVAAAREAVVNAAKHGGGGTIDVFADTTDGLRVFVRDRGPGLVLSEVPEDRRGVRESIVGRMARHGGEAVLHGAPGGGTEWELRL